jgi:choline dehydrogenase-like flavoprotein
MSSCDVIVTGSGAGGRTLAHRLAPSGKRIPLLERGGLANGSDVLGRNHMLHNKVAVLAISTEPNPIARVLSWHWRERVASGRPST